MYSLQLSDTETRDEEKMTSFAKICIFFFWVWIGLLKTWKGENDEYSWKN